MDPSRLQDLSGLLVILACGALLGAVRGLIYLADRGAVPPDRDEGLAHR